MLEHGRRWVIGCAAAAALLLGTHTGAGELVTIRVSPRVSFAPANLVVQTTVDARSPNRSLEITAESEDFYRSSEVPLEGDRSPRVSFFRFNGVPAGTFVVCATLRGVNGRMIAQSKVEVQIVGG